MKFSESMKCEMYTFLHHVKFDNPKSPRVKSNLRELIFGLRAVPKLTRANTIPLTNPRTLKGSEWE